MNLLQKILDEIREIKQDMVTKDDLEISLAKLREDIAKDTGDVINGFIEAVDERKAERKDLYQLEKRISGIETKLAH